MPAKEMRPYSWAHPRLYFDIQLPVWERLDGRRPIQLSFEGTSPLKAVEDLAADPEFYRPRADRSGA